jgi:hypothetical protein
MDDKRMVRTMTTATVERENLIQTIRNLPEKSVEMVGQYIEGLGREHEPNQETIAAILEGDKLARAYCSRFENDV